MPEVVLVHLSPKRFTEGFYRVEGDTLYMTYRDGSDVMLMDGEATTRVSCVLKPGDNPRAIAGVLTKEIRAKMHNSFWDDVGGRVPNDPITFPEPGIA